MITPMQANAKGAGRQPLHKKSSLGLTAERNASNVFVSLPWSVKTY